MNIIWLHEVSTVRDVVNVLMKQNKIAYTTVSTIMLRLEKKGFVSKKEKDGICIYKPKVSKESYSKRIAQSFINHFLRSYGNTAIVSFAESIDDLPKEKREYFLNLLKKNDKN